MFKIKYRVLNKGYELISENELLDILLKNRGVENPKEMLQVNQSSLHDGMLFKNMDRGLNMLHWHIENNSKIHILDDPDQDGITSSAIIYNYIKDINNNIDITHSMNDNKIHGIIVKNLEQYDFDLVIVPDAGSSDIRQCRELVGKRDVDILILDHHEMPKENNSYAVVINCQDGQYPNTTLSGAGVVYKFVKEYDKKYGFNFADKSLDLVAIGIIGDSMDLRNYETRYIALNGLNNINNTFVKEFIIKNKKEEENINFEFIGWKIAPFVNAVTRIGTPEERIDLVNAFFGLEETREYQPRRKHKEDPKPDIEIQTLQKAMIRESTNIKARQDRLVTKSMEELIVIIESQKLNDNKVIIVDATEVLEKSFSGLVANKLADKYKRPVIILKRIRNNDEEVTFGGSFRSYDLFPIVSFMDVLRETGTFIMLGGHPNAGGFKIRESKIPETLDKLNGLFKDINIEDVYMVDYEIPIGRLKEKHVLQVGRWANIWRNTLKKPIFAITDVVLKVEDIQLLGDKRNFIKIVKNIGENKISFVKKFAGEEIYNKMIMKSSKGLTKSKTNKVKMDIIGEFEINQWNDNEYPQINIIDFNVKNAKEFRF